ncbi:dnaJ domain protein, partial [Glaesserella parasuis 174]
MANQFHPDRNPNGEEMMKVINAAYDFLKGLNLDEVTHSDSENAYNFSEELAEIITALKTLQGVII